MKVTSRIRLYTHLQSNLFMVLLLVVAGLLAWLSTRYDFKADWTDNKRYTLSEASVALLGQLTDAVQITAFAANSHEVRQPIQEFVERYQKHKPDLSLAFIDPNYAPDKVRQYGVQLYDMSDSELVIAYQGRTENLKQITELQFTNVLQRLMSTEERHIILLEGHGERDPSEFSEQGLSAWVEQLKNRGFQADRLNFAQTAQIPADTSVLVIASPQTRLLPAEVTAIKTYLDRGGNLLWLLEQTDLQGLEPIAHGLGVTVQPGMVVDPISQLIPTVNNFSVVSITRESYAKHPVTEGLENLITLFPQAVALKVETPEGWTHKTLLTTNTQAWSETGEITGALEFNEPQDIGGPLDIAVAFTRKVTTKQAGQADEATTSEETSAAQDETSKTEQRVIVIGESDFLTNAFLHYGGNLDLALKITRWLTSDDALIHIPAKTASDNTLQLSSTASGFLGLFFLLVMPFSFIGTGVWIWLRRRKL